MSRCQLVLSTGESFECNLIGAPLFASGELVFTTGMVGYTEALTDPSYFGQILVFSYPLIGNYGVPKLENEILPIGFESDRIHASAVIVASDSTQAYHWNSQSTLSAWLENNKVPGITGFDTRHLVHLIRDNPGLKAQIVPADSNEKRMFGSFSPFEQNEFIDPCDGEILRYVSSKERRRFGAGNIRIGVIDCGVKWNIIRQLIASGCEVEIFPWDIDVDDVDCSGWLISNGPGDPQRTGGLIEQVKKLLSRNQPILGICLGHQIVALASGANTYKMRYGHRSHNQPVHLVGTRRGFLTSQNHGYVVDQETLSDEWDLWFVNANDGSVEGIKHKEKPFYTAQFHPEAAGGPRDSSWIISDFVTEVMGVKLGR